MKNILLLGATGKTGSALTEKLLATPDYYVTLFARNTTGIQTDVPNVTVISGDAAIVDDLKVAMEGQDIVYCAISGEQLPTVAENLVNVMAQCGVKRLIFMGAVGIYNEIPDKIGAQYNVDNEPPQVPNRQAVDVIEASDLAYTILRPGFLQEGDENDFVITVKGEPAKGYITTLPSVIKLAMQLIQDENLYVQESVSITKNMVQA